MVVAIFEAEWCGTYKQMSPFVDQLALTFVATTRFIKIDNDECVDLCNKFNVKILPSFLFFMNGQQIDTVKGASRDNLQNKVEQHQPSSSNSGRSTSSTSYNVPAVPPSPPPVENQFFDVTFPSHDQWNRGMQYESRKFAYSIVADDTASEYVPTPPQALVLQAYAVAT